MEKLAYTQTGNEFPQKRENMINAIVKTILYMLCSILGGLALFGLMVLMALNEWVYYVIGGGFVTLVLWKICRAFYIIFKNE